MQNTKKLSLFQVDPWDGHCLSIWYWRTYRYGRWDYTRTLNISWMWYWWRKNGVSSQWGYRNNGAKKSDGDTCLDQTLSLGYLVFNHINWNLQGVSKSQI